MKQARTDDEYVKYYFPSHHPTKNKNMTHYPSNLAKNFLRPIRELQRRQLTNHRSERNHFINPRTLSAKGIDNVN